MIAALGDKKTFVCDFVNESMLFRYPAGPVTGKILPERLWFPRANKGRAHAFFQERIDPLKHLGVVSLPVQVVIPRTLVEDKLHSMSFFSLPPPLSSSVIACLRRFAFLGLRRR